MKQIRETLEAVLEFLELLDQMMNTKVNEETLSMIRARFPQLIQDLKSQIKKVLT